MFQRTTLVISRESGASQTNLTPSWVGILGWISILALWGSYILIWKDYGLWLAIGAFVLTTILQAIVPIPYKVFKGMVTTQK